MFLVLKCNIYANALMLNFSYLLHLKTTNHPMFSILSNFSTYLNEEAGEVCFGVLNRSVAAHTNKSDIDNIDSAFKQIKTMTKWSQVLNLKCNIVEKESGHYFSLATNPKVGMLTTHFSSVLDQFNTGSWKHYPPLLPKQWKISPQVPSVFTEPALLPLAQPVYLSTIVSRCISKCNSLAGSQMEMSTQDQDANLSEEEDLQESNLADDSLETQPVISEELRQLIVLSIIDTDQQQYTLRYKIVVQNTTDGEKKQIWVSDDELEQMGAEELLAEFTTNMLYAV